MAQVNSHIQIPRCVLKQFEDSNHFVYWFDCSTFRAKRGHAKTINTMKGYYSEDLEKYLSEQIEQPITTIINELKAIDKANPSILITETMQKAIWLYFYSVIERGKQVHTRIENESQYLQMFSNEEKRNRAIIHGIEDAQYFQWFHEWTITFTINMTTNPFVLPLSGFYTYGIRNYNVICIPVTPYIAITLVPIAYMLRCANSNGKKMIKIEDPAIITFLNKRALAAELESNKTGIVSVAKQILDDLTRCIAQ